MLNYFVMCIIFEQILFMGTKKRPLSGILPNKSKQNKIF